MDPEKRAEIERQMEAAKAESKKRFKEMWENLPPFTDHRKIPSLPITDEKEWKEYFVPKLVAAGAIPKEKLVDKEYYYGKHRCTHYAQWNAKENVFNYWKWEIFGPCWDKCNHFEDDDHFALFVPIAVATKEQFDATGRPKTKENGQEETV